MGVKLRFDVDHQDFDINVVAGHFERERGLETYVAISMFSNARAPDDANVPGDKEDRGGFWGDTVDENPDPLGSLLWLLGQEKQSTKTLIRGRQYAAESIAWMRDVRMASSYAVTTEYVEEAIVVRTTIFEPRGKHPFEAEWEVQLNALL